MGNPGLLRKTTVVVNNICANQSTHPRTLFSTLQFAIHIVPFSKFQVRIKTTLLQQRRRLTRIFANSMDLRQPLDLKHEFWVFVETAYLGRI